ncbi:MAG: DEAD/DEAH box helicase [Thermodesulfovibrionia bacterium]|nr:DEAD/DEAH box helicase [Thermodesulfovibrionia bacterium]
MKKTSKKPKSKAKPIRPKISRTLKPESLDVGEWQRLLRKQYGELQNFKIKNIGSHLFFSEFSVANQASGRTYKVAIRGTLPGENYCSCPDFSINNLGTCKHIEFTLFRLMKKRGAKKAFKEGYAQPYSEVYLSYGIKRQVRFKAGVDIPAGHASLIEEYFEPDGFLKETHILDFQKFLERLPKDTAHEIRCYDDVLSFIAEHQDAEHRQKIIRKHLKDGIHSPAFRRILRTKLYPYQCEGALFAVEAGRCLIGDDMGLGKTIQALAAAEFMAGLFGIQKVLIISPTSLKYQWKSEIEKFSGRTVEVIEGLHHQRSALYENGSFYKLLNYELVHRDIESIRRWSPDLIILDEAQRIKNWKTRTAQYVKRLESPFAIVLTGTPIENRIEELHSIIEFIDRYHLGPLYRFVHNHRLTDENGKVIGYKDLQSVRGSLKGVMIRRKKDEVLKQLPERIDKTFFVPMTKEQRVIHDENYDIVTQIAAKWRRYKFLSDADQRRLQIALNYMRMAADNTYLVDKQTVFGPKIEELEILLREIIIEGGEKAVIFSQWLRMAELVERVLERNNIGYVHLNGSVPSKQRRGLMAKFKEDADCKVFLSTDAGGVGLNLQSGSAVINMDIPWNPAVLEQRIGRVHRLGQRRTVRVINFVTSASIEARILDLLKFKKSLFAGALDSDGSDVVMVGESQFKRFMQSVDTAVKDLKKPDPVFAEQAQKEAELDKKSAEAVEAIPAVVEEKTEDARAEENTLAALNGLLVSGAKILTDISRMISQRERPMEKLSGTLIHQDKKTGKAYLKIPLPEKDALQNIISAFGKLAEGIKGS